MNKDEKAEAMQGALQKVKGEEEDFEAMDAWDEKAIVDELAGKVMEEFIYRIVKGGDKVVVGLTWAGTKEIQRVMASKGQIISLGLPDIKEDADKYTIMVKATNMYYKSEMYGGAVQKKTDKFGNEDGFAFTKALSKAQRNAIRAHIPEQFAASLIDECLKGKNSTKVKGLQSKPKLKPKTIDVEFKTADKVEAGEDKASSGQVEMVWFLESQMHPKGRQMTDEFLKSKNKEHVEHLTGTEIQELHQQLLKASEAKGQAPP